MLKLYYAPGACSTASHIGLGGKRRQVRLPGAVVSPRMSRKHTEYLKINPRGRVPALVVDEGTRSWRTRRSSTTSPAKHAPQLMPKDPRSARRRSPDGVVLQQRPSIVHAHQPARALLPPTRRCTSTSRPSVAITSTPLEGDRRYPTSKQWIMGDQFTVVDGYALVFYGWGKRIGLPMADLGRTIPPEGPHAGAAGGRSGAGARAEHPCSPPSVRRAAQARCMISPPRAGAAQQHHEELLVRPELAFTRAPRARGNSRTEPFRPAGRRDFLRSLTIE